MGLYGFKPQFWLPVVLGTKRQTIRCMRKHPDKPGSTMSMVGNARQPSCFLLQRAVCERCSSGSASSYLMAGAQR